MLSDMIDDLVRADCPQERKQLTGSSKSSALTALPLMSSPMSAERRRTCEPLYSP